VVRLGVWNLGSISASVLDLVPDVPTSISGTRLLELADRKRRFVEDYTGQTIGSNSIDLKWQSILTNLTIAEVTSLMALQGADVSSTKLGDFSVSKGAGGNLDIVSRRFEERGMEELKSMGRDVRFYKALG